MTLDFYSMCIGLSMGYVLAIATIYLTTVCALRVRKGQPLVPSNPLRRQPTPEPEGHYINGYNEL